jgi:HAD hydrolase, family IA, variant 3
MKKGAIFDMDGLLFDTESLYQRAWTMVADDFGVERKPDLGKACSGTTGDLTERIVHEYHPTVDAKAYIRRVVACVHDEMEKNLTVMAGVHEILAYFREQGVRMATASSSTVAQIEQNLRKSGLRDYFDVVVGGDLVTHGKPAPDIFLLAAERIGILPADCYVFEDGYNGLRGAAAAGCAPVMIPDTMPLTDEMRTLCKGIYPSLSDAMNAIQRGDL